MYEVSEPLGSNETRTCPAVLLNSGSGCSLRGRRLAGLYEKTCTRPPRRTTTQARKLKTLLHRKGSYYVLGLVYIQHSEEKSFLTIWSCAEYIPNQAYSKSLSDEEGFSACVTKLSSSCSLMLVYSCSKLLNLHRAFLHAVYTK